MRKGFDTVIACVFALVIAGPACLVATEEAGLQLPSWLTSEDAKYLSGGITESNVEESLSLKGFAEKRLQTALESELGNTIPAKATAMLFAAAIERDFISVANAPFAWKAVPTKFNSSYVKMPEYGVVVPLAWTKTQANYKSIKKWCKNLRKAAEQHPDVTFVYDLVVDMYTSESNLSHFYTSDHIDEEESVEIISDAIEPSISLIDERIDSPEELATRWNKTEHHWKLERALEAYNAIGKLLGWKHVDYENDILVQDVWYGTSARGGLDLSISDEWRDLPTDFGNLGITIDGKPSSRGLRESYLAGQSIDPLTANTDFYWKYYGGNKPEIIYENPSCTNGKTCLFVETSYSIAIERYVADNYRRTVCIAPINCEVNKSLESYINEYGVDDVVIQTGFAGICFGEDKSAEYF